MISWRKTIFKSTRLYFFSARCAREQQWLRQTTACTAFEFLARSTIVADPLVLGINRLVRLICHEYCDREFLDCVQRYLKENMPLGQTSIEEIELHRSAEIPQNSDRFEETLTGPNALLQFYNHKKVTLDLIPGDDDERTLKRTNATQSSGNLNGIKCHDQPGGSNMATSKPLSGEEQSADLVEMHKLTLNGGTRPQKAGKKHRNDSKQALKNKEKNARMASRNGAGCELGEDETITSACGLAKYNNGVQDSYGFWNSDPDALEPGTAISEQDYSSLFYDPMDEDGDFMDLVDMFAGLFPKRSRQDLKIKIKIATDYQGLLEELFAEEEFLELASAENLEEQLKLEQALEPQPGSAKDRETLSATESNYSTTARQLSEIFPNYDLPTLEVVATKHQHDLNKATEELLAEPSVQEILRESRPGKPQHDKKDAWQSVQDTADELSQALGMERDAVIGYVHSSKGNYYESLVAVIHAIGAKTIAKSKPSDTKEKPNAWKSPPPETKKPARRRAVHNPTPQVTPVPVPLGGRVQGGRVQRGGSNKVQGRIPFGARNQDHEPITPVPSMPTSPPGPALYIYDASSEESREIRTIYESNHELRQINSQFVQETLAFFEGNVPKAVDILIALISNNAACLTQDYKRVKSLQKDHNPKIAIALAPRHSAYSLQTATSKFAQYLAKALAATRVSTQNAMDVFERNGNLDLHGFTVHQALSVTRDALLQWWSAEQQERIKQGNVHRYGTRAAFVGQINIITGRGLHSATGKSIIRSTIKKYLDRNGFSYTENLGSFIVKGRQLQLPGRGA